MSNTFFANLIFMRGKRKKAEFARFLDTQPLMYHRYEFGKIPQYDNLRVIYDRCNCTIECFLEEGFVSRLKAAEVVKPMLCGIMQGNCVPT